MLEMSNYKEPRLDNVEHGVKKKEKVFFLFD